MFPSPIFINKLICSNGSELDISQSNDNSPIIKVVNEIIGNAQKERFYDTLLENYDTLKLMTNPVIDMGKTDTGSLLYFFSSKLEDDYEDGKKSRKEHSKQCKYRLDPETRNLSPIVQSFQEMLASKTSQPVSQDNLQCLQDKSKHILFHSNDMYGYPIDIQLTKAFSDRMQLISLSDISHKMYENIIDECLRIGIGSVFQHICWCKKCITSTYAILVHGQNNISEEIKCPRCNESLYSGRFIYLLPEFEPLLESQGGFLPPLIGWDLSKKNYEWTADVKINQHEYGDIIFKHNEMYYLIESKIWSRTQNERGLIANIKKAIDQAIDHTKFWEEKNIHIEKIAIFTNQFDNETYQRYRANAINSKAELIDGRNLRIYPLKLISNLIREFIGG